MVQDFKPSFDVVGASPLIDFESVLDSYKSVPGKDETTGREYVSIEFNFKDVEVFESTEPYPFPIAQLRIGYSQSASTRWGVFAKSCRRVIGPEAGVDDLVGKRQRWHFKPGKIRSRVEQTGADGAVNQVWTDVEQDCWQLVSIEGAENPADLYAHVASLAEGKTEQAFNEVLFADEKFRSHPELVTALTERKLLNTLLESGKLTRDTEGVLHAATAQEV